MKNVFLYPGQGSQAVGMGRDLAQHYESARRRYESAAKILEFDLALVCFEGPEEELRQTRVTQPALYVHSCILTELLAEQDILPNAAAGHSLGEYSALFAAGVFSFEDGLRLVKERANAMQLAGQMNPGTMGAVVGLEESVVEEICRETAGMGVVVAANFNSPGQIVLSGDIPAVRHALDIARSRGAKLAKELIVSGAFHSPLMRPAAELFSKALSRTALASTRIPVISNVTARAHTEPDSIRQLLSEQLLSPVRWTDTILELSKMGDLEWWEVGSGNILSGLLKRSVKGASAKSAGTLQDLEKVSRVNMRT